MTTAPRRGLAIGILLFAAFMDLLDVTIVQVALPSIGADLDASEAQLEWIVSGYMLAFAMGLITGGRLGDLYGRRRVFLIGITGFTLASASAALAWSGDVLVLTRIAQGLFAALMVPQLLASVQALFSPRERAPMYGLIGGVSGLAAVLGPVLGGWLIDADLWGLGWRTVFLLNVPIGVVIVALASRFVPETRSPRPMRLDLAGVALLSAVVLAFMVPLVEGRSLGWPAWLWWPVGAGVALLAVFVRHERARMRRDGSALLPMPLFADRGFSAGIVTQAAFQGSLNAFTLPFIIYLQVGLGFDALTAGLNLLAFSLGAMVGTGLVIPLVARVGKLLVTAGAVLLGAGVLWVFAVVAQTGADFTGWAAVWPMLLAGVGLALLVIPLVDVSLATVPVADAGAASGAYSTFQQLGAAAGVAVSTTVFFAVVGDDWAREHVLTALGASVGVSVGGFALAAVASLLLPSRGRVRAHLEEARRLAEADAEADTRADAGAPIA
ncbi:MFS transporter [Agromyces aurantiacus]|uniref:MFS transporter n=1 Tax=Agromyces aurantiacus TaxID=165814 RepID=A0ABV9R521_9MICO|nr:MFS transporter [Agromyces aurantiacus]MBM7503261.1 EmrB/QacA subfamily drug resistance transporter [Agromyces aurantiacus]